MRCGGGFDWVLADSKDVVADDCEKVRVARGSTDEVYQQEDAFIESLPPAVEEFFGTFFEWDAFFEEQLAPDPFE